MFDLDPVASKNIMDQATMNPVRPGDMMASWYQGSGTGLLNGLKTAYNRDLFNVAGPDEADLKKRAIDQVIQLKPDPHTVGFAGQLLHGLGDTLGTVALNVAGGNVTPQTMAMATADSYAKSQTEVHVDEGVDRATAESVAKLEGIGVGLGTVLPAGVAGNLLMRTASGAGINLAVGGAQRALISNTLEDKGYADMARQYKVFDGASIATDIAIGALFGGFMGHRGAGKEAPKIMPSDLDTALTMNNAAHVELGTAPGIPVDPPTRAAHIDAVNAALQDLMEDRPVNVGPDVTHGDFIENPSAVATRYEVVRAVNDHLGPEWQVFEQELKRRGLPLDELDTSGAYHIEEPSHAAGAAEARAPAGAIVGAEASVKIDGTYHPVRWALVDAGQVEATLAKGDNQFRDRSRAASEAQINKIAGEPDFNLLGHSPIMDFGAPTMTGDGYIVGGNGRFAGVSKAYSNGTGESYRAPLKANLEKFGIDPAAAETMQKPVLVRVLQSDVNVQHAAMASNEGAGLRMSSLEQAKVDGIRLGDVSGLRVSETGDISNLENMNYIRQWVRQFPTTEAAALVDKNGHLSVEGTMRLRNAVLFQAYGDTATLERLVESTDPGARNVANALLRTAPLVAEAKAAISAGHLYPLDISGDIAAAIEILDTVRRNGLKVADYLAQSDMFGAGLSMEARNVLQFFGENIRSTKAISELIGSYYEHLKAAGDPAQASMFGAEVPTKLSLLEAAVRDTGKELKAGVAELPFAGHDPYSVQTAINDNPTMEIPVDGAGNLPAHEAYAHADVEIASAEKESHGFDAAVACALRG